MDQFVAGSAQQLSESLVKAALASGNDETLKTFLFGATLAADGLRDCYLLPAKTGVDVPPRLLSCGDPQWQAIYEDLQRHSRAFGTQLAARGDAIEVRCSWWSASQSTDLMCLAFILHPYSKTECNT